MAVTEVDDTSSSKIDATTARLRLDIYDPIAHAKGYRSVRKQAAWHGIHHSTMGALRAGENVPLLSNAMQIARDCGLPIEVLFGRAA